MIITFITSLHLVRYEYNFNQFMQMVERVLNKKLNENPELVEKLKMYISPFIWGVNKLVLMKMNYSLLIYDYYQ